MMATTLNWPSLLLATFITTLFSIGLWQLYGAWRARRIRRRLRQLHEHDSHSGKRVEWIIVVSGVDDILRR